MTTSATTAPRHRRHRPEAVFIGTVVGVYLVYAIVFTFGPMVFSLFLSFFDWPVVKAPTFVGLDNFKRLLTQDPLFYKAVGNMARYTVINVPVSVVSSLGLALILDRTRRFKTFFRTAYFLPNVTSLVACAVVWNWLYQPSFGLINQMLLRAGLPRQKWLTSPELSLYSVMIMNIWKATGYRMVIFMGALQNIPEVYNEAAAIDGASGWQILRYIKIPQLMPIIAYVSMTTTIGCLNIFEPIKIMTDGGPLNSSITIVMYLYRRAFEQFQMGYASTIGLALLVMIVVLTLFQFRITKPKFEY